MEQKTVSCIMPTFNRRAFVPHAIRYFLRQDYENKELIVVDDGDDAVGELIPNGEHIRYVRLNERHTVGAKRNIACEHARGEIIAHWDDDDWHAPHRLSYQVEALQREGADVCGITTLLFYDIRNGEAWQYVYPSDQRAWLSGSTLCYTRKFWDTNRFEDISVGEDARFLWTDKAQRLFALPIYDFHIGIIHSDNVSPKQTGGSYWHRHASEEILKLIGADLDNNSENQSINPKSKIQNPKSIREEAVKMFTAAKEADLNLTEFAAFNEGCNFPRMRRWEMPFALFQSRLSNTMAVLDCTINPAGFQEKLGQLYPHILYRHCNPVQNGQFALPFGVPDESFDRVFCINTLEHLFKEQREQLLAALARKLKPGGLLILTSDYYFDHLWEEPSILRMGVMRQDRQEVFNGWNKVTPYEWFEVCAKNNLHPLSETIEEPRAEDKSLYLNQMPYSHASIGGVFQKSPAIELPAGKKILLSLLIWNTKDVSVDSVRANLREARMLKRLGHEPFLCICDNGSTDGTRETLRELEAEIDVPYKMILNRENLGNSIARNQIIDYMIECDADYVLFLDGDIEIVPFSSFAMMRQMENCGSRLGCLGADSRWQSPYRERTSRFLYTVSHLQMETTNLVAWTQYGMFRREMFEDGIRFDENNPFNGAGWGFEDNDLAFQMDMKGYLNQRFFGMTYLHRDARSSIRIMKAKGIDAAGLYNRRRDYVIEKWTGVPNINNGPLNEIRRCSWFL